MILWKLRQRLILAILLCELLLVGSDNRVIASPKFKSSEDPSLEEKSRLDRSLDLIEEMDDSQLKVMLLNDLALSQARLGNIDLAIAILEQSLSIAKSFEDVVLKVTAITNIAKCYAQIGQKPQAIEILDNTVALASSVTDQSLQGQLLFAISLKYGEIGQEESAQRLFAQSQTIIAASSQPLPEFPFTETPPTVKLGFSGNARFFRDTTAFVGVDLDFSKQWSENDIFVEGNLSVSYDSSRTNNQYRPGALITSAYRHHFNAKWNFFTDFFTSTNQDLYSSKNDDEDLSITSAIFVGAGLNLWRGDSRGDFLDLQLGIGPRYEYEYIAFELRRNQIKPTLALILLGRGFSIGEAKLNHTFGFVPALNNFDNYIITSDTTLSIPLNQKWSFTNRLFLRYRNQLIFEENPKLEMFFSTGLEYEF